MTVHSFDLQLKVSEDADATAFFEEMYFRAFPNFVARFTTPGNTDAQRRGIDCLVYLANDRILKIDEKLRPDKAYNDILLEYTSNTRTKAPGWMEKDLAVDYLAYGVKATGRAYLLDWLILQRAWRANKAAWKKQYPVVSARNEGYETLSTPIPVGVLFAAMNRAAIVEVSPRKDT